MSRTRRWSRSIGPTIGLSAALVAGGLAHADAASAADTATWVIDHNVVAANKAQESTDEFYLAVIAFRSTPGRPGSTVAVYNGNLQEISIKTGQLKNIPPAMGFDRFPGVTRVNMDMIGRGQLPELLGTITIAFESDATPFSQMDTYMRRVRDSAKREIGGVVESITFPDLLDPKAVTQRIKDAADKVKKAGDPSTLERIGAWVSSWTDPDDKIASKVELFAAVDDTLPDVNDALHNALSLDEGMGGSLNFNSYAQLYKGDGANYAVFTQVHTE